MTNGPGLPGPGGATLDVTRQNRLSRPVRGIHTAGAEVNGTRLRHHVEPPAPSGTAGASNAFSVMSLLLGLGPIFLLSLYVGLLGLLLGLCGLTRHERLARTAIGVCLTGLGVGMLMSLFLYELMASLLYQR